jgi:hypothetical protein
MATVGLADVRSAVRSSAIDEESKTAIMNQVENAAIPLPDTWIYRIVVLALGLAIFVPVAALIAPAGGLPGAQLLLPIATGALGALAGLLAPAPSRR